MQKHLLISLMLLLSAMYAEAQHYDRGYEAVPSSPFVRKGTWVAGGTLRYSQHVNENYKMLLIDDINSRGYNISVSPRLLYMVKDNMGVGMKFSYDRSMLDLASAGLTAGEIQMNASDCYQISHKYSAHAVCRAYVPFGNIKRFALFADVMLGGSFKQGKAFNAGGDYVLGTYEKAYTLELAVNPGIVAFLTEHMAMELNVGIFGVSYGWKDQVRNQVTSGSTNLTSAGFMVNLLSIGVGISYYFL